MAKHSTVRNVAFAVLGAAVLVLKGQYSGPLEDIVHSYAGNFSVSFALYFAALSSTSRLRRPRATSAFMTLTAVSAFELTDGFGFMANVFDPIDVVANAAGIILAVAVDALTAKGAASGTGMKSTVT